MRYKLTVPFDGAKFAARYSLRTYPNPQFWIEKDELVVSDDVRLPDDPPVFEGPDAIPPKSLAQRLAELESKTAHLPLPAVAGGPR